MEVRVFRLFSVGIEKGDRMMKYDFAVERGKREDVLLLWVADMDFRVPEPILKRLHDCVDHGIFGYSEAKDDYFQVVAGWISESLGLLKQNEKI